MAFSNAPETLLSVHARYAAHAARGLGYTLRSLDGADGYLFEVSDGTRRAIFAAGAGSPYALNDARAASLARDKAFCAEALREAGLPVIPGVVFFVTKRWAEMRGPGREPEDALAYVRRAALPVFRHRLVLRPEADLEGLTPDQITADVLAAVDVPK